MCQAMMDGVSDMNLDLDYCRFCLKALKNRQSMKINDAIAKKFFDLTQIHVMTSDYD